MENQNQIHHEEVAPKSKKESVKKDPKSLKYLREKDREMVRGIFRYHECPGGIMRFSVRFYKEDPVENFELTDGEIYSIPLGVARHLNKNLAYPEYDYIKGEGMKQVTFEVKRKVRRCSFQSLEFIDTDDLQPDRIVSVTQAL